VKMTPAAAKEGAEAKKAEASEEKEKPEKK
jgi:hypothetical protein